MPVCNLGRAGVTVGAIVLALSFGLPLGEVFAEPSGSGSGSGSSSDSGKSESNGTDPGPDTGVASTAVSVGPNASDDDIKRAEDIEDKAWREAEEMTANKFTDLGSDALDDVVGMMNEANELNRAAIEARLRMRDDARAMQEAARADEQAALDLLRMNEPQLASGIVSGVIGIAPELKGLASQRKKSTADMDAAVKDRAAAIESIKPLAAGNYAKIGALAELQHEQTALTQLQTGQSAKTDQIMADAAKAEAEAGQAPIDRAAFVNEILANSADIRAKLQQITDAQTAALGTIARP